MLAFTLLEHVAAQLSYKPGYVFSVRLSGQDTALVSLGCKNLPNSSGDNVATGLTISCTCDLKAITTRADALKQFALVVEALELHEAQEWFKLDGVQVYKPHRFGDEMGSFDWADFVKLEDRYVRRVIARKLDGQCGP